MPKIAKLTYLLFVVQASNSDIPLIQTWRNKILHVWATKTWLFFKLRKLNFSHLSEAGGSHGVFGEGNYISEDLRSLIRLADLIFQQLQTGEGPGDTDYVDEDDDKGSSTPGSTISFSSSSYPHYVRRKYSYEDLRQLFRSVGCVRDEIRVECLHDANSMVVIENATFYAVPNEDWLNCTRGPLGPVAMGGLVETASELQNSIYAGVSGFSSLTTVRW